MIETELRLGNRILYSNSGEEFIVTAIDESGYGVKNDKEETWIEKSEFEPIDITEEVLIKCGFEKNVIDTAFDTVKIINYQFEDFVVYLLPKSFEIELIRKDGGQFNLFINCDKHLHQLQNLYYSLTGKELEYKL